MESTNTKAWILLAVVGCLFGSILPLLPPPVSTLGVHSDLEIQSQKDLLPLVVGLLVMMFLVAGAGATLFRYLWAFTMQKKPEATPWPLVSGLSWLVAWFLFPSVIAWLASGNLPVALAALQMFLCHLAGTLGFEESFMRAVRKIDHRLLSIFPRWIWVGLFVLLAIGSGMIILCSVPSQIFFPGISWSPWGYVAGNVVLALGGFGWAVLLCWLGEHLLEQKAARQADEAS